MTKRTGKNIICECPYCEAKLKIFVKHKACLGDTLASNNYVCSKCDKSFNLSEAMNLTVATK